MRINIFTLPYAFGASYIYNNFMKVFEEYDVNIIPIEYPGHGLRYSESLVHNIEGLAEDAYQQIEKYLEEDVEYAILGYSMGGKIAYELYKLIMDRKCKAPKTFFAFAADAPNESYSYKEYEKYDMDDVRNALQDMQGTPKAVLEDDDMLELLTPIIINDLIALRDYIVNIEGCIKIDCPVVLVRGSEELAADSYASWKAFCNQKSHYYEVSGGHFFLFQNDKALRKCVDIVRENLV